MALDIASGILGMALGAGLTTVALAILRRTPRTPIRPILNLRQTGEATPTRTVPSRAAELASVGVSAASWPASFAADDLGCRLRTPLNAVLGFCDILLTDRSAPPSPRQVASLGEIRSAGLALLNLVEAEIEGAPTAHAASRQVPEAAAVLPLLRRLCDTFQDAAVAAGVDLAPPNGEADLRVLADRIQLRQALQIVLDQAIRGATPGASLLPLVRRERDFVEIAVVIRNPPDLGFTVTAAIQPAPADQGGDLDRARDLAVAMGGRLEARGPGRGDPALTLLLPPAIGAGIPPPLTMRRHAAGQPPSAVPRRPVILYIEDNVSNVQLMRRVLDRLGVFDLYVAETGRTGLRLADQAIPDAVILDIDLPDLDGWTVKALLADAEATRDIPVLALSAAASAHDIRRGIEAGFLDYLTKPLDPALLAMALNRALGPGVAATDRPSAPKSRTAA